MEKINGTNLGNWLVLEKWMSDLIFEGTDAEDEVWLARLLPPKELAARMKKHRDTYVTEKDFQDIASHGLNLVRIPVPYFIFGDRPPFTGCGLLFQQIRPPEYDPVPEAFALPESRPSHSSLYTAEVLLHRVVKFKIRRIPDPICSAHAAPPCQMIIK